VLQILKNSFKKTWHQAEYTARFRATGTFIGYKLQCMKVTPRCGVFSYITARRNHLYM